MGRLKTQQERDHKKLSQREAYKAQVKEIAEMSSREDQEAKIQRLRDQVSRSKVQLRQKTGQDDGRESFKGTS